ncbi:MAG: hypothetical protein KJO60_08565 [Desulfofustis sp.]|nr:hypothetical protein [Desulfofustis sp.]
MSSEKADAELKLGPVGPRPYWVVLVSVVIRAIHQIGGAVYLSSFLLDEIVGPPAFYLWLAVISGVALVGTETMRHRQLYREVAGLATIFKVVLLGIAFHGYLPETATVVVAFFAAALAAHLPKNIRHRLVF